MSDHHTDIPADLRDVDAGLAALGAMERAGAPGQMTERIAQATRPLLARRAPTAPVLREVKPAPARRLRLFTPMRVAAAVSLLGALAAVRLAWVGSPAPAGAVALDRVALLEAEIDSLLGPDLLDDGLGEIGQQIDLMYADMMSMGERVDGDDESALIERGAL